MLVHEINFNKSQKITEYVHWPNATKLKINDNNTSWKAPNIWTLLVKEEIPRVIETYFTLNDNKNHIQYLSSHNSLGKDEKDMEAFIESTNVARDKLLYIDTVYETP